MRELLIASLLLIIPVSVISGCLLVILLDHVRDIPLSGDGDNRRKGRY